MRPLNEIIIHCTDTRPEWGEKMTPARVVDEIRRWHTDPPPKGRGWSDIGYHFVIMRDGTVMAGRPLGIVGAHVKGHNTGSIGISLLGGHGGSAKDKFEDHFTPMQRAALLKLIDGLETQYPTIKKISGHNQYAAKACPCFNVPQFMNGTAAPIERDTPVQSTTMQASAVQVASAAGAGLTAVSALSGTAQIVALVFCGTVILAALWIMRERLRKWSGGDR